MVLTSQANCPGCRLFLHLNAFKRVLMKQKQYEYLFWAHGEVQESWSALQEIGA